MQQTTKRKITVLIGDTSVRSRLVLSGMIDAEAQLEVVDTARSQEELLFKAFSCKPDVIVTQYGLTLRGDVPSFKALYGGPSSLVVMASDEVAEQYLGWQRKYRVFGNQAVPLDLEKPAVNEFSKANVLGKVREIANKYFSPLSTISGLKQSFPDFEVTYSSSWEINVAVPEDEVSLIVIGASTGGSSAIEYLVKDLVFVKPAIVLIAVHMPEKFTKRLARRLQKLTKYKVEEGYHGMQLTANSLVIAPGGQDMRVKRKALFPNEFKLELTPSFAVDTPSVDILMKSAAACAHTQVLGVILTGMGQDGTAGAREILRRGGAVIAQNEETSTIFGMAKSAIENRVVTGVFALGQINSTINRFVMDRHMSQRQQRKLVG